jgi:spore coat polysaccharide biosynthesis protein SpsF
MILAIIQARMSSSRLPGKTLKKILGKAVIGYLFERLRFSKKIDQMILATSENIADDILCEYATTLGVSVFRGNEENVLGRYYLAARHHGADTIVRITGDCPLIDSDICDRLITEFLQRNVDYAYLGPKFAEGLDCEIMKFRALEKSYQNARLASECEHVTQYIHNHKDEFEIFQLDNEEDHSHYRIVLDEQQDFEMLRVLFENYYAKVHPNAKFADIKSYLDAHPELMAVNGHIARNEGLVVSLKNDSVIK